VRLCWNIKTEVVKIYLTKKIYISKYHKLFFSVQMSLEITAELLKNAPVLLKRHLPLWQLLLPESAFGSFFFFLFFQILVTTIGRTPKPELYLPGRLRWTLFPKERYGNSIHSIHSVAVDRSPNLPIERRTLYRWTIARVVHGTYLSVPFLSHSNLCLSHPMRFPLHYYNINMEYNTIQLKLLNLWKFRFNIY